MDDLKILRPTELAELLSVSKMTLWRMDKEGILPKKVKLNKRSIGWLYEDIKGFLEERKVD